MLQTRCVAEERFGAVCAWSCLPAAGSWLTANPGAAAAGLGDQAFLGNRISKDFRLEKNGTCSSCVLEE